MHGSFSPDFPHLPPQSAKPRQRMVIEFLFANSSDPRRLPRVMTTLPLAGGWYLNCYVPPLTTLDANAILADKLQNVSHLLYLVEDANAPQG